MATATFKASEYDAFDPGVYDAVVDEITIEENSSYGPFRKWSFTVITDEGDRQLTAATSKMSGPKSNAYRWAATLLGRAPGTEEEDLVGLRCRLVLVVNEEGFNRVSELLPPAKTKDHPAKTKDQPTDQSTLNLGRIDEKVYGKDEVPETTF